MTVFRNYRKSDYEENYFNREDSPAYDEDETLGVFLTEEFINQNKERTKKIYSAVLTDFDEVWKSTYNELDNDEVSTSVEILSFLPEKIPDEKSRKLVIETFWNDLSNEEKLGYKAYF